MACGPRAAALCLGLALVGCQQPPVDVRGAVAHINGSMRGYSLDVARSVFAVITDSSFNIYLSDRPDLCTVMQMGASAKNIKFFRVGTTADAPQAFPFGAYTYPSGPGSGKGDGSGNGQGGAPTNGRGTRNAVIAASDDHCLLTGYNQAAFGDFVILNSDIGPSTTLVYGAFDVTFEVGPWDGEMTGNFVAPICPYATDIPYEVPDYCMD